MEQFVVHGITRSFFTRKVTGYLVHTERPYRLEPGYLVHRGALAAGWNGGIPVVVDPDGTPMWDSTSIIEHLDPGAPEHLRVIPDDPTLRFLSFFLDDLNDEWFYRPAVGSRWSFPDNAGAAGWQIAEELSISAGRPAADVRASTAEMMTASMGRLGVTSDNIGNWMSEVLVTWLRVLQRHLVDHPFLLGGRPCLADFAIYGANVAHFVGDPYNRDLVDRYAPALVEHTHRLQLPGRTDLGDWLDPSSLPETLIDILRYATIHYLPWVAVATVDGRATVEFDRGHADIATTPFLDQARGIMLARYVEAQSERIDAILRDAGALDFYADFTSQATAVPDWSAKAQPVENRPYPAS